MLLLMRKRIGSIVVKIFAFLLILGFGAWGIQDMLGYQVGGGGAVAEVGESRLGPNELYRRVNQEMTRMRPLFGNRLTMEMARKLGLIDGVLNRQIDELATSESARALGIAVGDELVRQEIVNEESFKGLAGNFDRDRFQQVLQSIGMSEGAYVEDLRRAVASEQLLGNVIAGSVAPKAWVNAVYRYRREQRVADSVFVSDASSGAEREPTDAELRKEYDDNKQAYTAPEYRAVTYVNLDAAELAKEISLGDDVLREAFERRADEFATQEKRKLRQVIISDEEKAKAAHKRLNEGADFLEIAKEVAGQDEAAVDLGEVTKQDLLGDLAEGAFAAPADGISELLKSPLGWHIFQVVSVTPGGAMTFEEARPKLQKDLAYEKALDGLYELSNKFEDALGGGASLEEAAQQLGLKVHKLSAIDAEGRGRDEKPIADLPGGPAFAMLASDTDEATESPMTEAGESGFYILRVDKIAKPALRPFEEVKDKVAAAWAAKQKKAAAEARAKAIMDAVNGGKPLAEVLAPTPLKLETSETFYRDGSGSGVALDNNLVGKLFGAKIGEAVMGRVGEGYRVAAVKSVTTPNPEADKKQRDELAQSLAESVQGDLVEGLRVAYRQEVGVKVYQDAIDQVCGRTQ